MAIIEISGTGKLKYGTAFCFNSSGKYVTTAANVGSKVVGEIVRLHFYPEGRGHVSAKVLLVDKGSNLAILDTIKKLKCVELPLGEVVNIAEGSSIMACGFYFKNRVQNIKPNKQVFINQRIRSIIKDRNGRKVSMVWLGRFGSKSVEGGPVFDDDGKVVGVITSQSGTAITVNKLKAMIENPVVIVNQPIVEHKGRFLPAIVSVSVNSILKNKKYRVILSLTDNNGVVKEHRLTSKKNRGLFKGEIVFFNKKIVENLKLNTEAFYKAGKVCGVVINKKFKSNNTEYTLDDVKRIEPDDSDPSKTKVIFKNNTFVQGTFKSLNKIKLFLGNNEVFTIKLKEATKIIFNEIDKPDEYRKYKIVVKDDGKEVFQYNGEIKAYRSKNVMGGLVGHQEVIVDGSKTVKLEGIIYDVVVGGAGRYLIFHLKKKKKIAIFDTLQLSIVKTISINSSKIFITAGAKKLIVLDGAKHLLQCYSLESFKMKLSKKISPRTYYGISMGSSNDTQFFMVSSTGFQFYNPRTFNEIKTNKFTVKNLKHVSFLKIQASADGQTFTLRSSGQNSGSVSINLNDNFVNVYSTTSPSGHLMPSYTGKHLYFYSGIHTRQLRNFGQRKIKSSPLFSSFHPAYYFSLNLSRRRLKANSLSIYASESRKLIFKIPRISELRYYKQPSFNRGLVFENRMLLIPQFNILVTIPDSMDKLILRRINFDKKLIDKNDIGLFVSSLPPSHIKTGEEMTYNIKTMASKGNVKYQLEMAPEGMRLSKEGVLAWKAHQSSGENPVVIVSLSDAAGQNIYHTFMFNVSE